MSISQPQFLAVNNELTNEEITLLPTLKKRLSEVRPNLSRDGFSVFELDTKHSSGEIRNTSQSSHPHTKEKYY